MYPYLRTLKVLAGARFRSPLKLDEEGVVELRAWPGDLDFYPEVNNGRHLTLMDLGRLDLAARTGLLRMVHREGWGLVIGGASIRYRRRLRPFRRFHLRTRLVGHDDRWFYFHHRTERQGGICSAALVRGGIRRQGGLVPVDEVLEALGEGRWAPELPDWVRAWIEAEGMRPWPGKGENGETSSRSNERGND
jgi:acyl-CoA thioesterase FadM